MLTKTLNSHLLAHALWCTLLGGCGGHTESATASPAHAGGSGGCQLACNVTIAGHSAIAGGGSGNSNGFAGAAGVIVISDSPASCLTAEGTPGILVDVFPLPEGPRAECQALDQPGIPDASCPSDFLYVCSIDDCYRARAMAGCCRSDGQCGLLEAGYWGDGSALGCISRDPWIEHSDLLERPLAEVRCDLP